MSQSDGVNQLKRFEFVFGDKTYKFVLNPEEYTQVELSRASIVQTRGGGFVDAWGAAFPTIDFKGTTGFKNGTDDPTNGFKKFKELADLIRQVYDDVKPGQRVTKLLKFYNYTDEEYWYTYPEKFALTRSKSKSLLYQYDVSLKALARIGSHNPIVLVQQDVVIGNDTPINPGTIQRTQITTSESDSNTNQVWLSEQSQSDTQAVEYAADDGEPEISKIIEVTAPVQVGVQYSFNIDKTEQTIVNLKKLMSNMEDIFGGSNGKISPVVAKYLTSNVSITQSGMITNLYCSITIPSGGEPIAFVNRWTNETVNLYNDLKQYSEDLIEVNKYYEFISVSLPKAVPSSGILSVDYKQLVPILLNQGDKLQDSNLVNAVRRYNINTNYLLMLKSIIINSLRVYVELKNYMNTYNKISISTIELDTLLNNIKYVSGLMENYSDSVLPIDLIKEIRKLHVAVVNVRGTAELFDNYSRRGY